MGKLLFLPVRLRDVTNQLTNHVQSEGHVPVSVCCRGGMIYQVI